MIVVAKIFVNREMPKLTVWVTFIALDKSAKSSSLIGHTVSRILIPIVAVTVAWEGSKKRKAV